MASIDSLIRNHRTHVCWAGRYMRDWYTSDRKPKHTLRGWHDQEPCTCSSCMDRSNRPRSAHSLWVPPRLQQARRSTLESSWHCFWKPLFEALLRLFLRLWLAYGFFSCYSLFNFARYLYCEWQAENGEVKLEKFWPKKIGVVNCSL